MPESMKEHKVIEPSLLHTSTSQPLIGRLIQFHICSQQIVCDVLLHRNLEEQRADAVTETSQQTIHRSRECAGQKIIGPVCVEITDVKSNCLFDEFTLALAVIRAGILLHLIPDFG